MAILGKHNNEMLAGHLTKKLLSVLPSACLWNLVVEKQGRKFC